MVLSWKYMPIKMANNFLSHCLVAVYTNFSHGLVLWAMHRLVQGVISSYRRSRLIDRSNRFSVWLHCASQFSGDQILKLFRML